MDFKIAIGVLGAPALVLSGFFVGYAWREGEVTVLSEGKIQAEEALKQNENTRRQLQTKLDALTAELEQARAEVDDLRARISAATTPTAAPTETPQTDTMSFADILPLDMLVDLAHGENNKGGTPSAHPGKKSRADKPPSPYEQEAEDLAADHTSGENGVSRFAAGDHIRRVLREGAKQFAEHPEAYADLAPEVQADLTTLAGYVEQIAALRDAMRNAATPEERDALRQQMRALTREAQQWLRSEQAAVLAQVAGQYGINDPAQQRRFQRDLQQTLTHPLFQPNPFAARPRANASARPR